MSIVNSGVTGRKLNEFLPDVEGSSLLLACPSTLQSSDPFRNASATNEGRIGKFTPISDIQVSGVNGPKITNFSYDVAICHTYHHRC